MQSGSVAIQQIIVATSSIYKTAESQVFEALKAATD
jgi:hypothetical protein